MCTYSSELGARGRSAELTALLERYADALIAVYGAIARASGASVLVDSSKAAGLVPVLEVIGRAGPTGP